MDFKKDETVKSYSLFISVRFLLACFVFLAAGVQYMQKIDMGIAIVCMVNTTTESNNNVHSIHSLYSNAPNVSDNDTCLFKTPVNGTTVSFTFIFLF